MTEDTPFENILNRFFDRVHFGVEWASKKLNSACPNKKPKKRCSKSKLKKTEEDETDIGPPCTEKYSYILPSQMCPKPISCCYIKMQDPYSPCCCEPIKPKQPPCPPKCHDRPREPICNCDLCKKSSSSHKCCKNRSF